MKPAFRLAARLDAPELVQNLVERLAYRRYEQGYSQLAVPAGWKALETSTTEAYISGTLEMDDNGEALRMPFITGFLFTCIKGSREPYQLIWSQSMN